MSDQDDVSDYKMQGDIYVCPSTVIFFKWQQSKKKRSDSQKPAINTVIGHVYFGWRTNHSCIIVDFFLSGEVYIHIDNGTLKDLTSTEPRAGF